MRRKNMRFIPFVKMLGALVFLSLTAPVVAIPYDIVLVTDSAQGETEYLAFLREVTGKDVGVEITPSQYVALDSTKIARLNLADLIIVTRRAWAAAYISPGEAEQWNAIQTPILLHNPHLAKKEANNDGRWDWINVTNILAKSVDKVDAKEPDDPVFDRISARPVVMFSSKVTIDCLSAFSAGNGSYVANQTINSTALIVARWSDLEKTFYSGTSAQPSGPRLLFATPETEVPSSEWTADGRLMLENALWDLLPPPPPPPPRLGDIVINEILYNDEGTDDREFIELKYTGDAPAELGYLELVRLADGQEETAARLTTHTIEPGAYWLVATEGSAALSPEPDESIAWKLPNTALSAVELRLTSGTVLDSVAYEGSNHSAGAPDTGNAGAAFGDAYSLSRVPDGWDTNDNTMDFSPSPLTPGARNITTQTIATVVIAGQSNASGRGSLESPEPPERLVWMYGNDYAWKEAYEPVDDATGQIDAISDDGPKAGHGFALRAGKELLEGGVADAVRLIPCAMGGSTLDDWRRRDADPFDRGTLFGSMNRRVRTAAPEGASVLWWYQGETDATNQNPDFASEHAAFLDELREETTALFPVIYAQLARHTNAERNAKHFALSETQRQLESGAVAGLERHYMVVTFDLPLRNDLHLDQAAQKELGRRFGLATRQRVLGEAVDGSGPRLRAKSPIVFDGDNRAVIKIRFDRAITTTTAENGYEHQFEVFDDGVARDDFTVERNPIDSSAVRVTLSAPVAGAATVYYGRVLPEAPGAALGGVVKGLDAALPAPRFGPIEVAPAGDEFIYYPGALLIR